METVSCIAGHGLDPSTIVTLVALALVVLVWAAQETSKRRQDERERSARVLQRLRRFRVPLHDVELAVFDSTRLAA